MATRPYSYSTPVTELFSLLAHPNTVLMTSVVLAIGLMLGYVADHPLLQACGILFVASLFARLGSTSNAGKSAQILGGVSLLLLFVGFASSFNSAGLLTLEINQPKEAYQRGGDVEVDYHLGSPLTLRVDQQKAFFSLGSQDIQTVELDDLYAGAPILVGPWRLSLTDRISVGDQPTAAIEFTPRQGQKQPVVIQLVQGQSMSPDGKTKVTALQISRDRGGNNAPLLGPAVELLMTWNETNERAWHYLNAPELSQRLGQAPLVAKIKSISSGERFKFTVQGRTSHSIMILAAALMFASVVMWLLSTLITSKQGHV